MTQISSQKTSGTTLRTERLLLQAVCKADGERLHELWTNREVRRYLFDNQILSREAVDDIIAASESFFSEYGSGIYCVSTQAEPDKLIGFCGLRAFDAADSGDAVELLYGVHPDYWKRGFGTEAARAALVHGFAECDFERVLAVTDTPNQRSVQVLQRLGMCFERRMQRHGLDTVVYQISQAEFARTA